MGGNRTRHLAPDKGLARDRWTTGLHASTKKRCNLQRVHTSTSATLPTGRIIIQPPNIHLQVSFRIRYSGVTKVQPIDAYGTLQSLDEIQHAGVIAREPGGQLVRETPSQRLPATVTSMSRKAYDLLGHIFTLCRKYSPEYNRPSADDPGVSLDHP